MQEFRNFVLGFCLSLVSVSLTSHLLASPSRISKKKFEGTNISIDLFKNSTNSSKVFFSNISKTSLIRTQPLVDSKSSVITPNSDEVKLADLSFSQEEGSSSDIVYSPVNIEGLEDDEILNINIDNNIPIDTETDNNASFAAEVSYSNDTDNKVALLPTDTSLTSTEAFDNNPWVIAQGSKHIKNKKLLEKYSDEAPKITLNNLTESSDEDNLSYKVAEKIKQSIIFPIPDEILNDENLTPTFISSKKKTLEKKDDTTKQKTKKATTASNHDDKQLKLISKELPQKKAQQETSKGLLDNISSWFSSPSEEKKEVSRPVKNNPAPLYSSQTDSKAKDTSNTANDALISFYETIQETQKEQTINKIIPSELKLSFQPDRAEISGQTLRWLKAFSEKSKEKNNYIQIRLDATAPIELQRKRLNLLYTIFMNNGVDFKKVDTVFSLTEPNTFIIRNIKIKE